LETFDRIVSRRAARNTPKRDTIKSL